MSEKAQTPRIYLEISGGVLHQIVVDGEVEVVVVDYDNAHDEDFDSDSVDEMLSPELHTGTAEEYERHISEAREALEDIARKNDPDYTP